jgi:hypothetical protein
MSNSGDKDTAGTRGFLNSMTDKERQKWAKGIVTRMMLAFKVDDHKSLAAKYAMHERTPSNWIQKHAVPWTAIYSCAEQTGRSIDWLYNGKEPPIKLSLSQRRMFEAAAKKLLHNCEQMGVVEILNDAGHDLLVTGMINNFLEIINHDR